MTSQEILDFMLGNKKSNNINQNDDNNITPNTNANNTFHTPSPHNNTRSRKATTITTPSSSSTYKSPNNNKHANSVINAYKKTFNEWIETDNTLEQIVLSIENLRERLWHTSYMIITLQQKQSDSKDSVISGLYRRNNCKEEGLLNIDDLQIALDHDLIQHEKMMIILRKNISTLSQIHDSLGRRLDEYYNHLIIDPTTTPIKNNNNILSLDTCQLLYTVTAQELYRKQILTNNVLNSINNNLLIIKKLENDDDNHSVTQQQQPRHIAKQCAKVWSKQSKESYLYPYLTLLKEILL